MINMQALKWEFQSSNRGVLRFNGGFFRFNGKILSLTGGQQCGYHIAWERRNACCWYINRFHYLGLLALFIFPFCRSVLHFFFPRLLRCYFRKPSACFIVGILGINCYYVLLSLWTDSPADSDFKSTTYLGRLTASPLLALRATPYNAISKVEGLWAAIHSHLCVMLDHGSRMSLIWFAGARNEVERSNNLTFFTLPNETSSG